MEIGSNTAEIFFQVENVQKHEWNVLKTKKAQNICDILAAFCNLLRNRLGSEEPLKVP